MRPPGGRFRPLHTAIAAVPSVFTGEALQVLHSGDQLVLNSDQLRSPEPEAAPPVANRGCSGSITALASTSVESMSSSFPHTNPVTMHWSTTEQPRTSGTRVSGVKP